MSSRDISLRALVSAIERLLEKLVRTQVARPVFVLCVAACTVPPAVLIARGLELRTGFGELLPENMPSVVELRRIGDRLPSVSTLAVTAECRDTALLKRFVDEMAPKLRTLPHELVSAVETGSRDAARFFRSNQHMYADLDDLESLRGDVLARYDWEISRAMGTALDEEYEPARIDAESLRRRFEKRMNEASASRLGDYYLGEDGHLAVIVLRTPRHAMDQRAFELQDRISRLVDAGHYAGADPTFRLGFTGNLVTSAEEYRSVVDDLTSVGIAGGCLVLLVVYLFFWRIRAVVALGISITLGCLWCFAFAKLAIGHLNTASGFLVSIVAGNGINAMVIYMARFVEARRDQGMTLAQATRTASFDTWAATLAAVGVSMVSYGALMTTDFRGFRHFGVIGAAGMLLLLDCDVRCAPVNLGAGRPHLAVFVESATSRPAERPLRAPLRLVRKAFRGASCGAWSLVGSSRYRRNGGVLRIRSDGVRHAASSK